MKNLIFVLWCTAAYFGYSQTNTSFKTIHVFVALCDNVNQGIVPVSAKLGNGQDIKGNLYWS